MEQMDRYFYIATLLGKLLKGELTADEAATLEAWIRESDENRELWLQLTDDVQLEEHLQPWREAQREVYWRRLVDKIGHKPSRLRIIFRKSLRYAAILIPLLILAAVLQRRYGCQDKEKPVRLAYHGITGTTQGKKIFPRGKVAKLILGNGRVISLSDSAQSIKEKDGTQVSSSGSSLHYAAASGNKDQTAVLHNSLITPRGGEYQVVLADGTKVWMNAASTLRFPTHFVGKERRVYLSGEAYFEVAPDARHPFIVSTNSMDITVLGTKFNVRSYGDEPDQKATLAEGKIRVEASGAREKEDLSATLLPGYEAIVNSKGEHIETARANLKEALAWKNGLFIFQEESLGSILRKLSRWYDVDVVYGEGVDKQLHFTGRIRKYGSIADILHLLELTGKVQFELKGYELTVTNVPAS